MSFILSFHNAPWTSSGSPSLISTMGCSLVYPHNPQPGNSAWAATLIPPWKKIGLPAQRTESGRYAARQLDFAETWRRMGKYILTTQDRTCKCKNARQVFDALAES